MEKRTTILEGNLWKQVFAFAIPIAVTSMLQQLFTSTDTAVVGRFAGSEALAAVGSTSVICALCITVLMGLSAGVNVRIAHVIGAGDRGNIRKSIDSGMLLAVLVGIALTLIGEAAARPLLQVLGTPEDIFQKSELYLRIYFLGVVFLLIYNVEAAILRAAGDTKRPLYSLMFSGVLNLCLNLLFVIGFHMGVAGVALGTLLADAVNAGILGCFLLREKGSIRLSFREFCPDSDSMKAILYIGVLASLQEMMFTVANMIMQAGFNSLGSDAVAAATVALNAEIFAYYLLNAFGQASLTFNGQNYGAGNLKRCRESTRISLLLGLMITMGFSVLLMVFAAPFARLFVTKRAVIELTVRRMRMVLIFEFLDQTIEVLSGAMRGRGQALLPAVLSAVCICGTRLVWIFAVFPGYRSFEVLVAAYPVSWMLDCVCIAVGYLVLERKGRWIKESVK